MYNYDYTGAALMSQFFESSEQFPFGQRIQPGVRLIQTQQRSVRYQFHADTDAFFLAAAEKTDDIASQRGQSQITHGVLHSVVYFTVT